MEPKYLDVDLNSDSILKGISAIADRLLSRFKKDIPKKRGGLNEITELRAKTAKLLNRPIEQVYGLTKGWSVAELYQTLHASEQFVNPPALWWVIYKKKKHIYGSNKQTDGRMGKERRQGKCEERQGSLF